MEKLTDGSVSKQPRPEGGRKDRLVFDSECRGLGVRVTAAGTKSFFVQWTDRTTKHKRREALGVWGAITTEQARVAARARLGDVAKGIDPTAVRAARRAEAERERAEARLTLTALLDDWAVLHLSGRRPRYAAEALRAIRCAFHDHLNRPASSLTRAAALDVLDKLVREGKAATAGLTLAYARACYRWAARRGKVPGNPFTDLPIPIGSVARERVLAETELGEIWRAAGTLGYPFGPMVRLLLLTVQRREEVAGMRWRELSADLDVWTLPAGRAKNHRKHVVHLSPEARAILTALPRRGGSGLVFTTTGHTPVSGFSKAKKRLDASLAAARADVALRTGGQPQLIVPWRMHDIRRTAVTWMADVAKVPPHAADKLLNHTTTTGLSAVARIYQRAEFLTERKAALQTWARHMVACGESCYEGLDVVAVAPRKTNTVRVVTSQSARPK